MQSCFERRLPARSRTPKMSRTSCATCSPPSAPDECCCNLGGDLRKYLWGKVATCRTDRQVASLASPFDFKGNSYNGGATTLPPLRRGSFRRYLRRFVSRMFVPPGDRRRRKRLGAARAGPVSQPRLHPASA